LAGKQAPRVGARGRLYFHVAQTYGLSDSTCWTTIRWVENTLIKSGAFRLAAP
jgi:hypothetical protein